MKRTINAAVAWWVRLRFPIAFVLFFVFTFIDTATTKMDGAGWQRAGVISLVLYLAHVILLAYYELRDR